MVLATRANSVLPVPFTQASFNAALKAAMTNAGFSASAFQTLSSGSIHEVVYDPTKARGKVYHQFRTSLSVNDLTLFQRLHGGWSTSTSSGSDSGTELSQGVFVRNAANPVNFYAFNHPEAKIVLINQGVTWSHVSVWRPANKISAVLFDEDYYPFAFTLSSDNYFYSCSYTISPYGSAYPGANSEIYHLEGSSYLSVITPIINQYTHVPAPKLYSLTTAGVAASFSSDISVCASSGLPHLQDFNDNGIKRYLLIPAGSCGLTITAP